MSWICKLWCLLRPHEARLGILNDVRMYDPYISVPSHLYRLTVGLVRDEADVLAGVEILVGNDSMVVIDEV